MSKFLVPHYPLSPVGPFVRLDPIVLQAESHRPLIESASRFPLTHARKYQYPHPIFLGINDFHTHTHTQLLGPSKVFCAEVTNAVSGDKAGLAGGKGADWDWLAPGDSDRALNEKRPRW